MTTDGGGAFPEGFLWGASSAAHQIEGGNVASDFWELEHTPGGPFAEPSGDACDSYHRWREDVGLLADLGLTSYRFSLDWSRIEPEEGAFSRAALDHYRRMVEGCLQRGVSPVVTLQHITVPRWFRRSGWWTGPEAADRFARFTEAVLPVVSEGVGWVCTINEPNFAATLEYDLAPGSAPPGPAVPAPETVEAFVTAHRRSVEVLRSVPGLSAGWTVCAVDYQPVGDAGKAVDEWARLRQDVFLEAARGDDFVGVQVYTRELIGPDGRLPVPDGAETTQIGWEYYPEAVAGAVRHAAEITGGTPIMVTENGVATADDTRRAEYVTRALRALRSVMDEGADVRGYFHWSLLDNFEWLLGYAPAFGLIAVDRSTFRRTVKPSARVYGDIARTGHLPD
ncbi:glycoside hydrolase family 1 protein [Sphaerisporangium corydalis]|uniref:Glycoside hydrolase family 1 protein n=1 Tax=Sphaerisporangium corydalis TaxID=1441875 RepID=A0ABV9E8Y7_9ACTN|nr:family 1 glycosylhydrolase [Sphaerisporangium corydalis]